MRHSAPARWLAVMSVLVALAGCTSSDDRAEQEPTTTTAPTTTALPPPIVLALSPNLDLVSNDCFAEIPTAPTPTETGDTSPGDGQDGTDVPASTAPTVPDTLPETTTIPRPPTIAIVDCAGTSLGQVYATFCLGVDADQPGGLTTVICPGDPDLEYPGDRTLRRTAARICLQRFEERFGERYAASRRIAQEFLPTEGVWDRGDRRVVCHSTEPPPPPTTSAGQS